MHSKVSYYFVIFTWISQRRENKGKEKNLEERIEQAQEFWASSRVEILRSLK
jgi:hypothetical protein